MKPFLPTFLQRPLTREITLALLVKLALIAAIFYAFFDGRAVHPDADAMAARLTGPAAHTQATASGNPHAD